MTDLNKKIFLFVFSFLFFIFTERAIAKMNRAPANPVPPIPPPSSYAIERLTDDIHAVQGLLRDVICGPTPASEKTIEDTYLNLKEIQKVTPGE